MRTHHGAKWNGSAGMIVDGNKVDCKGCPAYHSRQQEGRGQHLPHPNLSAHSVRNIKIVLLRLKKKTTGTTNEGLNRLFKSAFIMVPVRYSICGFNNSLSDECGLADPGLNTGSEGPSCFQRYIKIFFLITGTV
jgi:hypothetical protein